MQSNVSAKDSGWVRERKTKLRESYCRIDFGRVRLFSNMLSVCRHTDRPFIAPGGFKDIVL